MRFGSCKPTISRDPIEMTVIWPFARTSDTAKCSSQIGRFTSSLPRVGFKSFKKYCNLENERNVLVIFFIFSSGIITTLFAKALIRQSKKLENNTKLWHSSSKFKFIQNLPTKSLIWRLESRSDCLYELSIPFYASFCPSRPSRQWSI